MISALLRAKRPDADEHIGKMLAEADFQSTYSILGMLKRSLNSSHIDRLFDLKSPKDRYAAFVKIARKRHGKKIDVITEVFEFGDKLAEIIQRRGFVTDPEQRFFLALLMNVEGKERIFSLIKQRYPKDEPLDKVLDWVFDLSQTRVVGSNQQNALGIDPFDDLDLLIFEHLLRGKGKTLFRRRSSQNIRRKSLLLSKTAFPNGSLE